MSRLRWWIALHLQFLFPNMCWSDICGWAALLTGFPPRSGAQSCERERNRTGNACWCGRFPDLGGAS